MELRVENVCKKYGKKIILDSVSFNASGGERIGIIGANGAGKSTLLNILAGVTEHNAGRFLIDGVDLWKKEGRRLRGKVGIVPQGTPLVEELSAKDNLLLWYSREQMERELNSGVLSLLGIDKFLKVPVKKMSGGMKKRLSIGCSVASHPSVLLLDEPTASLDIVCREEVCDYIRRFTNAGGIAVISTHEVSEIQFCTRLYMLKNASLSPYEKETDASRLAFELTS